MDSLQVSMANSDIDRESLPYPCQEFILYLEEIIDANKDLDSYRINLL